MKYNSNLNDLALYVIATYVTRFLRPAVHVLQARRHHA